MKTIDCGDNESFKTQLWNISDKITLHDLIKKSFYKYIFEITKENA